MGGDWIWFPGLIEPVFPSLTIFFKLKKKLTIVASMRDIPDGTWKKESIGAWNFPTLMLRANDFG